VPVTAVGVIVKFPVGVVAVFGIVNLSNTKSIFPAAPESNAVTPGFPAYVKTYLPLQVDLIDANFAALAPIASVDMK